MDYQLQLAWWYRLLQTTVHICGRNTLNTCGNRDLLVKFFTKLACLWLICWSNHNHYPYMHVCLLYAGDWSNIQQGKEKSLNISFPFLSLGHAIFPSVPLASSYQLSICRTILAAQSYDNRDTSMSVNWNICIEPPFNIER